MMKRILTLLPMLLPALFVCSCSNLDIPAMNEGEVYEIWSTIHATYDMGEQDCVMPNSDLIVSLPGSVQTIIDYYYSRLPEHIRGDGDAAVKPLKGWRYDETLPAPNGNNAIDIAGLYAMKSDGRILFWHYPSWWDDATCDEFRINRWGRIRHIAHHERVQIDRNTNKPVLE